jgi:hypothetical protein
MKIKVLSLFILFLSLQGCSSTPSTPSLERAANFEKGISRIPERYYLFLEFRSRSVCSDECNCAPEAPAPLYEITSAGELWIERDLEGFPTSSSPIVGFFVFNDWGGRVYAMDTLPFTLQPGIAPSDTIIATVYSVDAEGTAVVEVYGETYFIKPGQAWTDSGDMRREPPAGCHISYSTSLTNFGLFSETQIRFGNPALQP